ncbi:replication-relaxation family protein [Peribacillus asahii]|uniref:replication-relaxation family protein n=1 Tax=Peribacillus asahii TaxID=228899 RepID=UPI00207A5DE4|nr:replication-relaxation family protein [Peribacillus asahii]USK85748.1 hypothetical protein LIT35_03515 [Peribacillus asahii]
MTIDQLSMAKIRHLQQIHELKSYSNACRVIKQLSPYVHETMHNKEKVLYLNKEGRQLIGSTKEVKKNTLIEHTLLRNEAYLYFNCPIDWKTEYRIESKEKVPTFDIQFKGLSPATKKVVSDAAFTRNGYLHLVEIDNTRSMSDNYKKIESYVNMLADVRERLGLIPALYIFTHTNHRRRKFESWMKKHNIRGEVKTFEEIK